jgi:hypothetical protein
MSPKSAPPAAVDEPVGRFYKEFMNKILLAMVMTIGLASLPVRAEGFVPDNCTVESWCYVKATECMFGHFTQPQGLWQGHAQYSVLRKVVALCPAANSYNGQMERRTILGPVEPIQFQSGVETTQEKAQTSAMDLCKPYRADWLGAAPKCDSACPNPGH